MHLFKRITAAAAAAFLLFPTAASAVPPQKEILTVIADTESGADAASVLSSIPGARLLCEYSLIDAFAAEIPARYLDELAAAEGIADVHISATFGAPAAASTLAAVDPSLITEDDAAIRSADPLAGDGCIIAVLDSGFDVTHPAFTMPEGASPAVNKENYEALLSLTTAGRRAASAEESLWVNDKIPFAYDYDSMDKNTAGLSAHGTHVAATAAGYVPATDKSPALPGTVPAAQLLLMKIFDDAGENCREYALIHAVQDAVALGADVINLSLGSLAASSRECSMVSLTRALQAAEAKGILIVCAIGNDAHTGIEGLASDMPRASDPDYGTPSEPAVIPEALGVAAASNSVIYAEHITAGGKNLFFSESYEVSVGKADPLRKALGGKTLTLRVIPGLGKPEDYEESDVTGCAVLIRRGEITFEEKVRYAAEAGAAMAILYDPEGTESFLMSVGSSTKIPAVSLSKEDGAFLASLDGTKITVSDTVSAFPAAGSPLASYSSYGPTSDLVLKPDITAVGSYIISAIPGGGYGIMSGTSMATPQIAGMALRALSEFKKEADALPAADRADLWRSLLISAAEPMKDESGMLLTPRAQGGGLLTDVHAPVMILPADGGNTLSLRDKAEGGFSMGVRILSLSDKDAAYTLSVPLITDAAAKGEDGVYYITGKSENVPHTLSAAGENITRRGNTLTVTVPAGGEVNLNLNITPDEDYVKSHGEIFTNGFYLEGYVVLTANGEHAASLPYMAFAGHWIDAPMLDALDFDGKTSYYGENLLLLSADGELITAGDNPEGVFSSLFAFSPGEDKKADSVALSTAPLRNISQMDIEITDGDDTVVYTNTETAIMKSVVTDGNLRLNTSWLWDGSDGVNSHFHWQDGTYTVKLTLYSYAGTVQIFSFPLAVDTEKPTLTSLEEKDGILHASFRDAHFLKELRIYLPGEGDTMRVDERLVIPHSEDGKDTRDPHAGAISAAIPADAEYVYVSAEDYAGNLLVLRYYLP